jgi:hypothetical protein
MLAHTSVGTGLERRMGRLLVIARLVFIGSAIIVDGSEVKFGDVVMAREMEVYRQYNHRASPNTAQLA